MGSGHQSVLKKCCRDKACLVSTCLVSPPLNGFSMVTQEKLGGFKILKAVSLISPAPFTPDRLSPAALFRTLAEHQINLPYVTCVRNDSDGYRIDLAVEAGDARTASDLIQKTLEQKLIQRSNTAILSIFPHRKKPAIAGALFEAFGREGIQPDVMAHSPSAISAVLDEKVLVRAGRSLFGPFAFSAYRTPEDWKLAQKGKEKLYKEVVASYQEKRPKVYGLEYQDRQELLRVAVVHSNMGTLNMAFEAFSRQGLDLTFLAASRSQGQFGAITLCLPMTQRNANKETIARAVPQSKIETRKSVGTFSMNGPHFGDRYGIVRDLLTALERDGVNLMGLSCTIASITGVVLSSHLEKAIKAIQGCFDVPSILKTDRKYE